VSWLKASDTAALFTPLMLTATLGDERTVNEVAGWIHRCMEQAASQRTDYLIDMGTAALLGGSRLPELIRMCRKVKLIKIVKRDGFDYIEVVQDPAFLHVILKAEQDYQRQRERDNSNPQLTSRVRLRDGDACRWCGVVVYFGTADRKSARVGEMDHLELSADKPATVDKLVVACRQCNGSRQKAREGWDRPLLPPPPDPYYSKGTKAFIYKHLGIDLASSDQRPAPADNAPQRPGQRPDNAPGDLAASETTPSDAADLSAEDPQISADVSSRKSGFTGSGRVGSGQAVDQGSGLLGNGFGRDGARGQPGRRRRSARGKPPREGA
jgi:hypothetical protein